ncbi:MAG: BamA/TamA family outer membrane protein [Chitinophagaceae bacterium]|jgi:hypothetical protein
MHKITKRYLSRTFKGLLLALFCLLLGSNKLRAQIADQEIVNRIIIIGDAGKLQNGKNNVTSAVSQYINSDDEKVTIVFAGDNLYPKGLPEKEDKTYQSQANVLRTLLLSFKNYKAKVYVIPGNHDWQKGGSKGWEAIRRQENFINDLGEKNMMFLPHGGCPGPEEIPLSDSITMVIMDTQWWLHSVDKPGTASDCDCKTESEVLVKLEDIAYRNKNKRIIFIAHHPLRSHGEHGGYYTLKQHIFPFTDLNKNAFIPLPIIGSIYPVVRGKFGNVEDLPHPLYKDMVKSIEQAFKEVADVTYVGGHEHNLQLLREGDRNYIVSGSGTNRDRVKKGKNSLFASDENGFTEIVYTKGGQQKINYFTVNEKTDFQLAYSFDVPFISLLNHVSVVDSKSLFADSITVAIAPHYDAPGKFHRFLFGEHYRKIWATPTTMSVFHLEKEMGGMKILKKGGGQQTKSLRLEDKNGKQWVLRTIQKNPEKALPANLKSTIAKPIVQDQTSAANPYAAITVPTLAQAAGIQHTSPRIVYIPDDPAFGIYRNEFAKTICLFEQREPGVEETYSTQKVLDKLEKDNDNSVDEKAVLRARMLDLMIGDWDRHEDQWRWTKKEVDKKNIYSPIPRDRDQVYYINTGILPFIAGRDWIMPKLQGFGPTVKNVNGFMFNARYFDRLFLHELSQNDWVEVIRSLQQSWSNEVIGEAIKQLPDSIYSQIGQKIISSLISRRDNLMVDGLHYFRFLSKTVDIPASDKKEMIRVKNDSGTIVTIQKIKKDGSPGDIIYSRMFDQRITKEIRLYGRDGKDQFVIDNELKSDIKIRMIGGDGEDSFYVNKKDRNHLLIYDRFDKANSYPVKNRAALHISTKSNENNYNPRSFRYDRLAPIATAGFNLDDGVLLGVGAVYTKHGFRKEPFASKHKIMIGGAFATGAAFIKYKGDITDFVGKATLDLSLNVHAPDNTTNFFGIGNETTYEKITDPEIRYYRTRYNFIDMQSKLRWPLGKHFSVFTGIAAQYFNMDLSDNSGRFIAKYELQHKDQELFDHKIFAGALVGYEIDTRNDSLFPVRGFHWKSSLTGMQEIDLYKNYGQLQTEMSFYISFSRYPKFVVANRIGAGTSLGTPEFFQMFYLGGERGLMGYRKNRFSGSSVFYNNLELRMKLFDFTSYLFPGTVGLIGFNDVGRVWVKNESSDKWHIGYGGGLYIIPAEAIVINAMATCSEEGLLPYISLGFRF